MKRVEESLLKYLLKEYYDIVEEDLREGHFVETDFVHYSKLVRALVENTKNTPNALFFTGLCIPPFKWYNFNIEAQDKQRGPKVRSVKEIKTMQTDIVWVDYLKFVRSLTVNGAKVHRCIFSVEPNFSDRGFFEDLVEYDIINAQFTAHIIFPKNDNLQPLAKDKIANILKRNNIAIEYKCYEKATNAYLIIDKDDITAINLDKEIYGSMRLRDHFTLFQPDDCFHQWVYTRNHGFNEKFPDDFFMFGSGTLTAATWHVVLAADVAPELNKVTLWFMTEDLPANERYSRKDYRQKFNFRTFTNFINNTVIPQLC